MAAQGAMSEIINVAPSSVCMMRMFGTTSVLVELHPGRIESVRGFGHAVAVGLGVEGACDPERILGRPQACTAPDQRRAGGSWKRENGKPRAGEDCQPTAGVLTLRLYCIATRTWPLVATSLLCPRAVAMFTRASVTLRSLSSSAGSNQVRWSGDQH